ncbi:hypothetical protein [Corynebacterium glyciniphilum]|uniref:hypothetical protein n=1 Tax=Corynebacterium glyciniphilum TaxID=1404244 RepID=UPI003FD3920F
MNIDVTVVSDGEMWSEKFDRVKRVEALDDGSLAILRPASWSDETITLDNIKELDEPLSARAMFQSGSWHSWRQVKD